jgi:pimeloyl-ACP methyl ester carboxylesterase
MERIAFDPASVPPELVAMQLTANALPDRAQASIDLYESLLGSLDDPAYQSFHRLEDISAPTLIITGRNDPRASSALAEAAIRRIPQGELMILERCGHAPMLEHPGLFNARLRAFLDTHRAAMESAGNHEAALG